MSPGVAQEEIQAVPHTLRGGDLEAVVAGVIAVLKKIHDPEEGETGTTSTTASHCHGTIERKGPSELLAAVIVCLVYLVDVPDAVELDATISNISHLQGRATGEGLLDIGIP